MRAAGEGDNSAMRQEVAVVVFLAVTVVEAFFNAYFRILVSETQFREHEQRVLSDLDRRVPLALKVRNWIPLFFGRELDESEGLWFEFRRLRELRNSLMHFRSSHQTFSYGNVVIEGLADTTPYSSLSPESATWAHGVAEGVLEEIFRLRGLTEEQVHASMHQWAARVPV